MGTSAQEDIYQYARRLRDSGVSRADAERMIRQRFPEPSMAPVSSRSVSTMPSLADDDDRSSLSNLARGLATGVAQAGTTTLEALGTLTRSERLRRAGERYTREVEEYFDPEGRAGDIGRGVGRIGGEIGTSLVGGGALLKGATAIPKVGMALRGATATQRALAAGAAQLPLDVIQGAKEEEGILLPGRAGAIAESVGLGALGTGLSARRGLRAPAADVQVPEELSLASAARRRARETGVPVPDEPFLTPSVREQLGELAPAVEGRLKEAGAVKRVKSIEGMQAEYRRLIDSLPPGAKTVMTDEEFAGRAGRIGEYSYDFQQFAKRLNDVNATPADRLAAEAASAEVMDKIVEELRIVQPTLRSAAVRMATARHLGKSNIGSAVLAARRLLGLPNEVKLSDRIKDEISLIFTNPALADDPKARELALQKLYSKLERKSLWDVVLDVRRWGLLSNPATWAVNFLGSKAEAAQNAIAHPIAVALDTGWAKATGARRTMYGYNNADEWIAEAAKSGKKIANPKALLRMARDGVQADSIYSNSEYAKTSYIDNLGLSPEEGESVFRKAARLPLRVLDIAANTVYGLMETADIPFYRASLATSYRERAMIRALNEGLGNSPDQFLTRVKELMQPENMNELDVLLATEDALDATFKTKTGVSRLVKTLGKPGEYLVPFANTPANIVRKGFESIPGIGFLATPSRTPKFNQELRNRMIARGASAQDLSDETRRQFIRAASRQITTGMGGITAGYLLHQAGILTPEYTPARGATPEEREAMQRRQLTGESPLSLRIGDKSYSLSYMATLAPALAIGAALSQAQNDDIDQGIGLLGVSAKTAGRTILNMPLLEGVSRAEQFLSGGMKQPEVALGREVGSFVPSVVAATARGIDVTPKRTPETFGEAIAERIPVLRERLAPTPGPFGEVQEGVGLARSLFDPTRPQQVRTGGVYDELQRLEAYPGQRQRRPEESAQAYFERRQREGEAEQKVLEGILSGERPSLRGVSANARREFRRTVREQGEEAAVRQLVDIALRQQRAAMTAADKQAAERQARREGYRRNTAEFTSRVNALMAGKP